MTFPMTRHGTKLAILALVAASIGAQAQTPTETLAELAEELAVVRSAASAEPVWSQFVEVSTLAGLTRDEVLASLGDPDLCGSASEAACRAEDPWGYFFYYLPDGWQGGGPELWLEFDSAGVLVLARWYVSR